MPNVIIDKFFGGLSLGSRRGQEGSFRYGLGMNFRDDPDVVTSNMALVKESGSVVVGKVKFSVASGSIIYSVDEVGNIYKNNSGSYSVLRTVSSDGGQGLEIYGDYMYYRQNSQIGRMALSGETFTDNWQTSNVQAINFYGVLKTFLNLLLVANGRYVGTWDDTTWTYNKLTFPKGYYVQDISIMGEYAVFAVNDREDVELATKGFLVFWDGTSLTYNFMTEVSEGGGISSIQGNQNSVYVFAGGKGNIYEYNGLNNKVKKIPFIESGKLAFIAPGATTNYKGKCYFGITTGTSITAYKGLYSWGKPEIGYNNCLNLENAISTGTLTGVDLEITCVKSIGSDLYVAWKDGSTYGIDKLSTTTLLTTVTCDSLVITTNKPMTITRQKLFFKPLASGESITLYLKLDQGSWVSAGSASYSSDGAVTTKLLNYGNSCDDVEVRIVLSGSSTMPSLSKVIIEYSEDANL